MSAAFFQGFLMISSPMTIGILAIFIALLIGLYMMQRKGVSFGTRVILATVLGAVLGFVVQIMGSFPDDPTKVVFIKESTAWFNLVGGGFINLIQMLIIPLVFITIIHVTINMTAETNLKKLVNSTVVVALVMVAIAATVGLVLGSSFHLGHEIESLQASAKMRDVTALPATIKNLIPKNPISAMAETNVIGIVIFGLIIGSIVRLIKQTKTNSLETFHKLIDELYIIVSWMADFIIGLMPYGVLALLATTLAQKGVQAILDMGLFIVLLYVGLAIMFIIQALMLSMIGLNPFVYFAKAKATLLLAFTSRSSMGVLPSTIDTLTEQLGVNPATASTVASFGTTAGMQGCAGVFPALCVVYIANTAGVPLDLSFYVLSVFVIAIGSVGIAGIPGTATMAASVSLSGTGLGAFFGSISPVLAIDPIIDMGRTMLNVSGAMTNALFIDHRLGTLNKTVYNDPNATLNDVETKMESPVN